MRKTVRQPTKKAGVARYRCAERSESAGRSRARAAWRGAVPAAPQEPACRGRATRTEAASGGGGTTRPQASGGARQGCYAPRR